MQTTIDFLRHGEASGGSYYRGSTDDPLTPKGWQQMQLAITNHHWDHIISSPLIRCLAFAQQTNTQEETPLTITDNWQEMHFGDWEGKTADQINQQDLMQFYKDPVNNTPANAEAFSSFLARVNLAWSNLINTYHGKHVLVITHAGVIRALFKLHLDLPANKLFNLKIDHASLTRFQCFHDTPKHFIQLEFHNLTQSHLYSEKIK